MTENALTISQVTGIIGTIKLQIERENEMIESLKKLLPVAQDTKNDTRIKDSKIQGEINEITNMIKRHEGVLKDFEDKLRVCETELRRLELERTRREDREGPLERPVGKEGKERK